MNTSVDLNNFDFDKFAFRQVGIANTICYFEYTANGTVNYFSSEIESFLGYDKTQLQSPYIGDFFPTNDSAFFEELLADNCDQQNKDFGDHLILKHSGEFLTASLRRIRIDTNGEIKTVLLAIISEELSCENFYQNNEESTTLEPIVDFYAGRDYDDIEVLEDTNAHLGLYNHPDDSHAVAAERLLEEFYENIGDLNDKTVLDIGCGLGHGAVRLASDYGCKKVEGITISTDQIKACDHKMVKNGLEDKVNFSLMDANNMTFAPQSFDVVCAMESIFHMNRDKVFGQVNNILKDQGVFAFCDIYPTNGGILYAKNGSQVFVSIAQTIRLLRKHGFKDIRFIDWSDRTAPSWRDMAAPLIDLAAMAVEKGFSLEQTFEFVQSSMPSELTDSFKQLLTSTIYQHKIGNPLANYSEETFGYAYFLATK
ncbi:MAG: ubiquinone/menaquinone biosynthesis C-methylase UbiE [Phenylobacterium sp.]|jgi:ubiquinone/menaquinone biosynthesis C-methylase UbiE